MKITDKYILNRFLKTLGFAILAFILVVVIVDVIENVDKFIDYKTPILMVFYYYLLYLPFIIVLVLPIAVLLSTMFTVGGLARFQELTVMKATGLSLYRLSAPILIAGLIMSLGMVAFSDFVMVPAEARRDDLKRRQIEKRTDSEGLLLTNVIKAGQNGWVVYARSFNEKTNLGDFVVIQKIDSNQVAVAIKAKTMAWADSGWLLIDVAKRVFAQDKEIEFSRYDTLYANFLSQTPETMSHKLKKPRDTKFFELLDLIKLKKVMGQDTAREEVELYLKFSVPFINFIIIIMGIPLAANPRRSGGSVGFGLSIMIGFIYFIFLRAGQSFGYTRELPPPLAAWIGDIVFFCIGAVMFIKAKK